MHSIARTVPSIIRSFMPVLKKNLILGIVDTISITALSFIGIFSEKRLSQDHWLKKVITLYPPIIRIAIIATLFKNDFSSFMKTYFGKFFIIWIMRFFCKKWFIKKPSPPSKKITWFSRSILLGLFLKERSLLIRDPFFYQLFVFEKLGIKMRLVNTIIATCEKWVCP